MIEATLRASEDNPVPGNHTVGYFTGDRGKQLRYAIFRASRQVARGTVVLLHGRNECIEKYFETVSDLTAMGFWVATFDTRGQGGSERLLKKPGAGHRCRSVRARTLPDAKRSPRSHRQRSVRVSWRWTSKPRSHSKAVDR